VPDFIDQWVSWGAGLRAAQTLVLGAKARALLNGRVHVSFDDIRALAHPTFRHRVLLSYKAEAEGVTIEDVIDRLLSSVPTTVA
jgi:MoxR-like ATPase